MAEILEKSHCGENMNLGRLITGLQNFADKYGDDLNVNILTESEHGQIEQVAGDVCYSPRLKEITIVPEGF